MLPIDLERVPCFGSENWVWFGVRRGWPPQYLSSPHLQLEWLNFAGWTFFFWDNRPLAGDQGHHLHRMLAKLGKAGNM